MDPDAYLFGILFREAVNTGPLSPVRGAQFRIEPLIKEWAGRRLISISPSGSFARGTANRSGTDIDLFISLRDDTREALGDIYEGLFKRLSDRGHAPTRQNVSIKIKLDGYSIDLVPARQHPSLNGDHSLYRRKAGSWTKTNVGTHINHLRLGFPTRLTAAEKASIKTTAARALAAQDWNQIVL